MIKVKGQDDLTDPQTMLCCLKEYYGNIWKKCPFFVEIHCREKRG